MTSTTRTLAILSDIHIGPSARSSDLCPVGRIPQDKYNESFSGHFADFVSRKRVSADHLLISGDLSSASKADEFLHASELICDWARALNVPKEEIYFVPGNHDVDWQVLSLERVSAAEAQLRWAQRYDPFTRSGAHFLGQRAKSPEVHLFEEPFAGIWESSHLLVGALNSAAHDEPKIRPHHGYAAPKSLEWLDQGLARRPPKEGQLRIFLVHHHPFQYADPYPELPEFRDFSIMTNAESLLALLRKHGFNMLVHGHKHVPKFETVLLGSDFVIPALGAGSFCVELGSSYAGSYTNQFHLVEFRHDVLGATGPCGTLRSWAYTGPNGWQPANAQFTGIEHEIGFGGYLTSKDVEQAIANAARPLIISKRRSQMTWSEVIERDARLNFISPKTKHLALQATATTHGLQIAGAHPGEVVLFK